MLLTQNALSVMIMLHGWILGHSELTHWGQRQNCRHFADAIFKFIFLNENVWILISLKFVRKGRINSVPALVQIMAWHRPGDKSFSEPMVASLLRHTCVTRAQWVNGAYHRATIAGTTLMVHVYRIVPIRSAWRYDTTEGTSIQYDLCVLGGTYGMLLTW